LSAMETAARPVRRLLYRRGILLDNLGFRVDIQDKSLSWTVIQFRGSDYPPKLNDNLSERGLKLRSYILISILLTGETTLRSR
jgi:hypothetical protein